MSVFLEALAAIGVMLVISRIYSLLSFIWLYARPSTVCKFLHGPTPAYALITGASDGIGKAVALELYDRGFNIILHGRNEEKVRKVAHALRARAGETRDVRYFIADAGEAGHNFAKLIEPFKELNITLVIHNVGGMALKRERIDERSESELMGIIQLNALFSLMLTRILLPQLRFAAKHGPVLVQFTGSLGGEIGPPRTAIYAASKAFLKGLTRALDNDERAWKPTGVRFAYAAVGQVVGSTMNSKVEVSAMAPSADRMGAWYVDRLGCGRRVYYPYLLHAFQFADALVGEAATDILVARTMKYLVTLEEKNT
ncbi:NAD(P)-binding protein [Obba rivulosa]|uniref:NAD(P)-binding protein n=1 Tax=Obba rivulosa TaxID=1052685 RepID=A0A8E2DSI3_9APHY|nr:NAD(P)-binding protein [Obba rivulosa]